MKSVLLTVSLLAAFAVLSAGCEGTADPPAEEAPAGTPTWTVREKLNYWHFMLKATPTPQATPTAAPRQAAPPPSRQYPQQPPPVRCSAYEYFGTIQVECR
jgi:hypothetical protein